MADNQNPERGSGEPENDEPVVFDKRRIDPETGKVRTPADSAETEGSGLEENPELITAEGPDVETSLSESDLGFLDKASDDLAAERLADLQRVTAEYANYRKRTEANRDIERDRAVGDVVKGLLPVLDDFDRAEKHGDLDEGPFVSIAQKLRQSVERLGLKPFGAKGDPFDPQMHEAIFQQPSDEVESETIADVIETGYYLGSSLLRAAKVVVAVPHG